MKSFKKISNKVLSVASWVIVGLLLLLVCYYAFCSLSGKVAFLGNRAYIKIVSSSMEPTIPTDEYIFVEKVSQKDVSTLQKGDVIVFYSRDIEIYGKLNTHRIVDIINDENGTQFVTKGDNNSVNDELTTSAEDVVGRYIRNSNSVTGFANFFSKKPTFFLLIIIPSAVLVFICIYDVIKKSKAIKMDLLVEQEVERLKQNEENSD